MLEFYSRRKKVHKLQSVEWRIPF